MNMSLSILLYELLIIGFEFDVVSILKKLMLMSTCHIVSCGLFLKALIRRDCSYQHVRLNQNEAIYAINETNPSVSLFHKIVTL